MRCYGITTLIRYYSWNKADPLALLLTRRSKCRAQGAPGGPIGGQGLRQRDAETVRHLVAELSEPFREAIVLREILLGTMMSRFARARSMLRRAWIAEEGLPT